MLTNFFYLYDRFFESNRNNTTEHVKTVKIPGFFSDFCSKFQVFSKFPKFQVFFCLNSQTQVFTGFQVKSQP